MKVMSVVASPRSRYRIRRPATIWTRPHVQGTAMRTSIVHSTHTWPWNPGTKATGMARREEYTKTKR